MIKTPLPEWEYLHDFAKHFHRKTLRSNTGKQYKRRNYNRAARIVARYYVMTLRTWYALNRPRFRSCPASQSLGVTPHLIGLDSDWLLFRISPSFLRWVTRDVSPLIGLN